MLQRAQRVALIVAVVSSLLGLGAGGGCTVVPKGPPSFAWVLHPIVVALGIAGGWATSARKREIDHRRWQLVQDESLTKGEREYAHREAEREIRTAGTIFLLAATGFGFWMAYQFNDLDRPTAADLLVVSPLLGFVIGLWIGARTSSDPPPKLY